METTGSRPIDERVKRAVEGDGTAFTALWDTYIVQLRAFLRGWLGFLDDFYVDDICSRSFEKAFRQIGSFDPSRSQFFTWLKTIAHNTALDIIEQENRARPLSLDEGSVVDVSETMPDEDDSALETIIRTEDMEATRRYIDALPELYREVARKRLVEGMQYKEIADETGLTLNTVRTRIRRAKSLIDRMSKDREDDEL